MRFRKGKHGNPIKKNKRRTKNGSRTEYHTGKTPETE